MVRKAIVSAEESGELPEVFQDWIWFKSSTGELYEFVDGNWVLSETLSLASHSHPTHGDINFTGTVSVGGDAGLTGEFEGTFKKIRIVNGIITEFELEE